MSFSRKRESHTKYNEIPFFNGMTVIYHKIRILIP